MIKAVLTRCLTLASLIALSTALSADSRLSSTGASGFLYSDYLQTAASGRSAELQGSFVVENHRPFFANIGAQLPRRIVGEIKTLPLREWGLDYVFENRRPAHQSALAERGWRIADWLAEETLMAATESGRGGGLIRTLEFDLQSELGGRRGSAGLNVLGALRETADHDALAWQLRGFKTKDGGGGSAGLIYRWLPDETALVGVNAFADYETRNGDGFWRWSAGAEIRTAWADLFGNYYQGITDDKRRGDEWIYTADGYDVELNVHSPDLPWLVGEIAYFNWKGRYGDSADRGFRFGVKFKPATGVELALEYERRNSDRDEDDGDNKKEWSGWVRYAGKISKPIRRLRSGGEYNNYEPRDYFFSPAEREYTQRIRKAKGAAADGNNMRLSFTQDAMPINLESADLDLEIDDKGSGAWVTGTANGQQISAAVVSPYVIPNAPLITLTHKDGTLTLTYPKTKTTADIGSEVAVATLPDDFLHLADGNADITVGTGGGGTMFVAQYVNPDDFILRFGIPIINVTQRISLATTLYFPEIFPENAIFTLLDKNGMTISSGILGNLRASIQLAADPFFRTGTTPPIYYKAKTATGPFVVATLQGTGGGGGYVWTKEGSGELEINGNVVSIPAGANVSESGVLLSVRAVLNDSDNLNLISRVTPPITADFTVSYREIADLAAKFNPAARNVYGLAGEGAEIVAATITAAGGADAFTYAKTGGQLNVRSAGGNGGFGHAVIPASILPSAAPGAELVLEAELSQPIPGGSSIRTIAFSLTVRYVGVNRISSPAFAAESGKAILAQSPTFYRVTALADNNAAMDIATLNEATGGGGGNKTYAKVGGGGLNFNTGTRKVSIPANTPPTGQRLGLTVRIADSGAGSEVTPEVTVMLTVQYVSVNRINLGFDDPDGLVTVFGLRNNNAEVGSVARAVADGGFGGVTVGKAGNAGLGLRGTEIYIPANNPPQAAPGRALLITVSANDNAADDPNDITDAALATMTLRYVQVQELSGGYLPVNTNGNGQAQSGARAINGIHTVGMAAVVQNQFTVASLSVSGGVGDYQYRQIGRGNLSVDSNGQILMAANVQPSAPGTGAPFVIVVEVNDRGTNDDVTPAITLTLTVSYNTIVPIEADVTDTRNNAAIKTDGGTVYFKKEPADILTPFGRLNIRGGFGGSYRVAESNASGITYNDSTKMLSMTKCSSGTKRIRLTIDDVGSGSELTPNPLILDIELTNECVARIAAQLRNAADNADATSPLNVYGLENASAATVAAVLLTSGGSGNLTWTNLGGQLELNVANNKNELRVRAGTTPQAGQGRELVFTGVLNDPEANGGFLTDPLTVLATVNYIAVPGVELRLNHPSGHDNAGSEITGLESFYGVAGSANNLGAFAAIETSGGADGATRTSELAAGTTPGAFVRSGDNINFSGNFPAFGTPEFVTAVVLANDSYSGGNAVIAANVAATPPVEKKVTARLLPVRDKLQPGGIVGAASVPLPNVVSPTSPSATEGNFTVYVLAGGAKEAGVIARVGAASVADNAGVDGLSGLRVIAPTEHSSSGTGLQFQPSGNDANVMIAGTTNPTSGGVDLNLVLEYNDIGHPVSLLTAPLLKTVRVHYESVAPFVPQFRNVDDSTIPDGEAVTAYVAAGATDEVRVARLNQIGGANGMGIVSQSGRLELKNINGVFYAVVPANTGVGSTLHLTVRMDDAPNAANNSPEKAQGSRTPAVVLELTVAYLETRDVQASFADITGNDHFLGTADSSSGVRTLYFKDGVNRPAELDILRINAQSGSGDYTFDGGTPDGFALKAGTSANNRVLALLQAKADGAMAVATVKIDDTGAGSEISEPATLTVSVAVKDVEAIEAKFVDSADADLGELHVISRDAPNAAAMVIAKVVAAKGVNDFQYTKETGSSDKLSVNGNGEVMLDANQPLDGQATLTIIVRVADQGDGSTLTDDVLITLRFVLAETVRASAFLLNNNGNNLPDGTAGADLPLTETQTIRVKTANYETGQVAVGITPTGGLGEPYTATETGATGLSAANTAIETYALQVAVDDSLSAGDAPATLAMTAVVNDGNDTGNLTDGATITVSVVYDKVDPIAGAFKDTSGNAIAAKHVVVNSSTNAAGPNEIVASIEASGGVGGESGGNYTFSQMGNETGLIVNNEGKILVKQGTTPKPSNNELTATARINDNGKWSHVSDAQDITVTVVYSSQVDVVLSAFADTRANADPAQIDPDGGTLYFNAAEPHANVEFGELTFQSGLPGVTNFIVTPSAANGLAYNSDTRRLSVVLKCDESSADKSIKLVVNDDPDPNDVSEPLTLDIAVHSGAAECISPINAQGRTFNPGGNGQAITEDLTAYALAGVASEAVSVMATLFIEKGAPEYTSTSSGDLNLSGSGKSLTVEIPVNTTPGAAPDGTELDIDIRINDTDNKGGFLTTDEATVKITVNYIAVQPHGQFTADKAGDVLGDVASRVLTVRRVAKDTSDFDILTNMQGANPAAERIEAVGNAVGIRLQADTSGGTNASRLVMAVTESPDGNVRVITIKVVDYNPSADADLQAQFDARPDKLFTISVYYHGELEAAAYDSEDTATEITLAVNRYVEQANADNVIAVATLSVSGGDSPYTYQLTGDLALADNNASVVIPTSATATDSGTALTARIVINDTDRDDTAPATVELTANYILIDGHSNLVVTPDGGQPTDLNGETVYPLIVGATSSSPVAALRNVEFKTALDGATLTREDSESDAELLFDATAEEVRVAGDTPLNGQTVSVVLRGSDGDGDSGDTAAVRAQKAARSDRLYTLQVRYLQALSANAKVTVADGADPASGADYGDNAREIRVATGTTAEQNAAYIEVVGGTEGYQLAIDTTKADAGKFELDGRTLKIKAGTEPGALPNGNELTAFVKVNDDESKVGGPETGELNVEVRVNYIALPKVAGIFVHGRDGMTLTLSSVPLTVYSKKTNPGTNAPVTLAAIAEATVTGRTGDTFTFHKIGTEGKLEVGETSGEVMLQPNRPGNGQFDLHVITVEFSAAINAAVSRQTLTVRHQLVEPIVSGANGIQSRQQCHPGDQVKNLPGQATAITVSMWVREEGYEYRPQGSCAYLAFAKRNATAGGAKGVGGNLDNGGLTFSTRDDGGLVVRSEGNDIRVGVANNQYDYTAETNTLSVVIVYSDTGPGSHVSDDFLRTVYVVFPGVPKIEAALKTPSGGAISKELTVYVGATDANPKLVATVTASGGEGGQYSYTGTRLTTQVHATALIVDNDGKIFVPAGFTAVVSPGTNFQLQVAVDDTNPNSDATRRGATSPATVILTLQYIKTSGSLAVVTEIATSPIADTANAIFYHAKGASLSAPLNVANIQPSGGIPDYEFEIQGNPAQTDLILSGTENTRLVQLKKDAIPSAADSEARRRMITVRVSDTGDVANGQAVQTMLISVTVNFVEVTAHADLVVENGGNNIGSNFVVVRPTTQSEAVAVADKVAVAGASLSETDEADGLSFVSAGNGTLVIDATTNPPTGRTLTIVLSATDGTATPQEAARQDRLYTVAVRYVPAIAAEVRSTTDAVLGNTDVVELTVVKGNHLVGKVVPSGGVGGNYSYALTPNTHLEVDETTGEIRIKADVDPVAGDGLSITVNIEVDDAADADDSDATPAANVQIRVKYVELEDLTFTAKDLDGNDVAEGDSVGTFYLLQGATLTAPMLVATVTASGGIKDYKYTLVGTGGDLTFNPAADSRALHIPVGKSAATPGTAGATLSVTLKASDSQKPTANEKLLIVRAVFETVQRHGDLVGTPAAEVDGDLSGTMTVRRVAADNGAIDVVNDLNPANVSAEDLSVEGTAGDLIYNTAAEKLQIKENVAPNGQTLVLTLKVADKDSVNDREDTARPDRLFTLSVVYAGLLAAAAYDSETETAIAGDVNRYVESDSVAVAVATVSVSGGTSPYTYAIDGDLVLGTDLANMTVLIPASATATTNEGTELTAQIVINDTNRNDTAPKTLALTANYILIPGHSNLTLVRDGETTAEDLDGSVIYPLIRGAQDDNPVAALSEVGFKTPLVGESLSRVDGDADLLFDATAKQVRVAGGTAPIGQTLTLKLRGSDGDGETSDTAAVRAQKAARSDRLYMVAVRYLTEFTAQALDRQNGTQLPDAPREIRVQAGTTAKQAAAYIETKGGTGGYTFGVNGDAFEMNGNVLEIKATTTPGALPNGNQLEVTVTVNDNESEVGGAETDAVEIELTVRYIALPLVEGSFVDGRDGTPISDSQPVTVFSKYTLDPAPVTLAAVAKATVTGRENDTFTVSKIGGGILLVDKGSGEITVPSRRPQDGEHDTHIITVEFSTADAVASQQTLTVVHQMVRPILSQDIGFQSRIECHGNTAQVNSNATGSLITVILPPAEDDTVYSYPNNCNFFASGLDNQIYIDQPQRPYNLGFDRSVQTTAGLEAYANTSGQHAVRLARDTDSNTVFPTFTDGDQTLSIVIAYDDKGPGSHVTDTFLRTVYVVFPGVPKIAAVLEDASGANVAITDPLTIVVAGAGSVVVASVKTSGGEGGAYSYTGKALNNTTPLVVSTLGKISTPEDFQPVDRPGTMVVYEVAVNDTGGDETRRGATSERKVTLTLQYIKSAGTLVAEAVIANPAFADAAATTFYSEAGKTLTAPIDVARIAPTGGLPPYNYAVVGGQNADLGISRASGTDVQVQLKVDDTPSAADRVVTLEVSDSADLATPPADVSTLSLTLTVKFVGVAGHNDLAITRESGIAVNSNGEYVAVRAGAQNEAVNLLSGISTNGTLSRPEGDAGGDAELVWTYASNSGRLAISVGTKPEGKTLSVVLSASDGEATPQKAARQDRLYTISVRYVPAIEAGVRSTTDAALGDADVVELTVLQGVHLVGSISVSGGVGGAYSYTATPATLGGTTLHVDSEGNIRIPTTLAPVAGDGLSITVNIAVDDDKESTDTDRDATSPANVQIRVKYVELEDLALTAKNLQGADVGATDSVGTFYLLEGKTLTAAVLVATVTASGGIKDYIYAVEGGGGDLTFDLSTREVHIAKDKAAQTPGTAGATLSVKVKATDKRGETATLTLRAVFETVPAHPLVEFQPAANSSGKYVVVRAGAQLTAVNVARFEIPPEDALTKTEGDDALVLAAGQVQITANHRPTGKTLTAIITQTDGNDDAREIARPDRLYTISVRYVPAIEARVEDASNAEIAAVVELTVKKGAHFVGSVSVSGGVGGDYSYTPTGVGTSQNLEVDDDGNIRIPTTLEPVAGVGLSITVNIRVDDDENSADSDRDATLPVDVKITVKYVLLESPEIEAQTPAGVRLDNTNTPTFYRLAGATSTADITAAKVVGRKGKSPYTFAIVDADAQGVANGLAVESNGNIVLKSGATPAAGANANRVVTVRLTDDQDTAETAEVELTVRFEQVETHADVVFTPQSGVTQNDAKEYRVVQAGVPGANVHVLDLASGGDTLSITEGDADLVLVAGSPNRLEITSSAPRNRQTLTAEITQTDGDDNAQEIERPDRTYTVSVRYIPAIEARVEDASNAEIAAVVELTAKQGAHLVGSVSVSGGVGGDYSYVASGVDTSQNLEVDADGNIRIPATLAPVAGDGLSITVNIAVDDDKDSAASDRDATSLANVRITVKYVELESPEIEARDKDGTAALTAPTGSNAAVFYQLSGVALDASLAVAKVVGSKGKLPYAFAIVDDDNTQANAKGLEVNSGTGDITLVSGESTTQTGTAADRVITVRLSDNQRPTAETADATLTIRFEAVAPHPDLTGETGGAHVQSFDLSDNLLTVLVDAGETGKQAVVTNVAVAAIAPAAALTLTKITGNLNFDASAKEISIPDGTDPTGENLSVVLSASDGTDPPQAAARPDKTYSLTVRYLSHVGLSFVGEVGNSLDVTTSGINVRRTAGTTPASVFVASLSASGGAGSYNYSISGHTETGKAINFDTNSNILWIPPSFVPSTSGVRVDIVVTANDNEAITDEARQEIQITYIEAPADPLSGDFVAAAPSSNSRIVGAFDDSKRVTVYGVEADGTSDDLPVMTLSHSNNAVAVSKETGELNYASGQVVIPKAMRKTFGTEFTGVFLATDRRAATADARYSLTVLLAQQLSGTAEGEELFVDAGREAGHANPRRGQYFYTDGRENAAEFRPVLSFPNITVEGLAARSANNNFQWDFATKQMRRNGAPETNHAADELVTLIDPAANPKILPAPLTLDVRNRELPVLSFVSPESTATEIPHTATPTTPVWTFRVKGGALTRKPYRPFHNLTLSPTGAFVVAPATPPRVDDTADTDGESEFADFDVRVDFTHADAALRRGQTLTVTVTAEDIGYPGLGAVSHVAEVVLEAEPIPHLQAGVWTPVASGATQITQPVIVTAKLSTSHNVASVSVSRGRPANNQRYTYTGQRINGTGDALTLSEHGVITIPRSTEPIPTPGLTVTFMVTADDTGHPETDPAEVRVTVVYVLQEVLQAGVRNLDGSSLSGTPIIYRLADEPAPVDGLNVVQVVARGGRAPYRYFVHEDSNPGNLIVKDNGIVAIAADETPDVSGTRLVTVRVEDNQDGDLKETAFATITMNFRAVARHSDLQISLASGIVTNSAGQYIAVREGAQNEEVALLSVQVDNADSLSKSGDNQLLFNKHANTDVYRLRIAPGTEPTGQTLEATLAATDGESDAIKATRPDRDYPVTVRYLANLKAVLLDAGGNPIPDLDNIDIQRKTSGASIFVGSLSVTGGTGGYQFSTLSFTGMGVDENGNVFVAQDAQPPTPDPGRQLVINVGIDDSGDDFTHTPQINILVQVDYILQSDTPLPGDFEMLRTSGGAEDRICANAGCTVDNANPPPAMLDSSKRLTMYGRNSDNAAAFLAFSVNFANNLNNAELKEDLNSDLKLGTRASDNSYPVMLPADKRKAWGEVMELRLIATDGNTDTRDRTHTVTVLLSEMLLDSAVTVDNGRQPQNDKPEIAQYFYADGQTNLTLFQPLGTMPGLTVEGLEASVAAGAAYDYEWDFDSKQIRRSGTARPRLNGDTPYLDGIHVEATLIDPIDNPKIIQQPLSINIRYRNLAPMIFRNPRRGTRDVAGSATGSEFPLFVAQQVQGGSLLRKNFRPFSNYMIEVDAPFKVIGDIRKNNVNNDEEYLVFDIGIDLTDSAVAAMRDGTMRNVTVRVRDTGYPHVGVAEHTYQVRLGQP